MKKAIVMLLTICICVFMWGCGAVNTQSHQHGSTQAVPNYDTTGCIDPSILDDSASQTATP